MRPISEAGRSNESPSAGGNGTGRQRQGAQERTAAGGDWATRRRRGDAKGRAPRRPTAFLAEVALGKRAARSHSPRGERGEAGRGERRCAGVRMRRPASAHARARAWDALEGMDGRPRPTLRSGREGLRRRPLSWLPILAGRSPSAFLSTPNERESHTERGRTTAEWCMTCLAIAL